MPHYILAARFCQGVSRLTFRAPERRVQDARQCDEREAFTAFGTFVETNFVSDASTSRFLWPESTCFVGRSRRNLRRP